MYRQFYNHDRANQSLACGNRPPFEAFPELPVLPHIPEVIDPDAWLTHYHRHIFKRRVSSGSISVGNHTYYVGRQYSKERVGVMLDAEKRVFYVLHKGQMLRELEIADLISGSMPFQDYLKRMLEEARTLKTN